MSVGGGERPPALRDAGALSLPRSYSTAYESFVADDSDLVGLVAYALFKGTVRADAVKGTQTGNARDPSDLMVGHMRDTAEQKLRQLIDANLEGSAPELRLSAATEAAQSTASSIASKIDTAVAAINSHTTSRTSSFVAFGIAVLAWVATLALTVLIIVLSHAADPVKSTTAAAQKLGRQAENVVGGRDSDAGQ